MTTQVEVTGSKQIVQSRRDKRKLNWPWVAVIVLSMVLIVTAFVATLPAEKSNQRALEAISARYQSMAELYEKRSKADSRSALEAISTRYQGMAKLYTKGNGSSSLHALEAISNRYQGLAELYTLGSEGDTQRALEIISARFQAQAEYAKSQEK